jgi:tetratricopeptide (TPR) repeat protein
MRRLTSGALTLSFGALTALSGSALAESQADLAAKLNEDGKELMYAGKYTEASAKFREAVARVPEAKYFFNLCTSLFQEGKFSDALTACDAVEKNKPSAELQGKATKLIGRIESEATAQGLKVSRGGGGGMPDPNTGNPNPDPNTGGPGPDPNTGGPPPPNMPPPVVGRPPTSAGLFQAVKPANRYVWTLGANLFGGGGQIGQPDVYGNTVGGIELHGNFLWNPAQRIGTQAYIQYAQFTPNTDGTGGNVGLTSVDLGLGLYKHICPPTTDRLCLTPMLGAQLALYSPEFDQFDGEAQFNYAAVGVRAELGLEYAFGRGNEHVLSLKLGVNGYSPVISGPSDDGFNLSARMAGLDRGGGYGYFGIGYTHRFSTPLGASPFITLE